MAVRIGKYANVPSTLQKSHIDYAIGQMYAMFGTNDVKAKPGDWLFCKMEGNTTEIELIGFCGVCLCTLPSIVQQPWEKKNWRHCFRMDPEQPYGDIRKTMKIPRFIYEVDMRVLGMQIKRRSIFGHEAAPIHNIKGDIANAMIDVAKKYMI